MSNIIHINKGFSKQDRENHLIAISRFRENIEGELHRAVRNQMRPAYHKADHAYILGFVEGALCKQFEKFQELDPSQFRNSDFPQLLQLFVNDLSDSSCTSLSIPYVDVTVTLLFFRLHGEWIIYDMYYDDVSVNTQAFSGYMERFGKTKEDVFS